MFYRISIYFYSNRFISNKTTLMHSIMAPPTLCCRRRQKHQDELYKRTIYHSFRSEFSIKDVTYGFKLGKKIQHVTYRITISKDNQTKVSDFFHSHRGDLAISSRNANSTNIGVEGTFDTLTNAIIPDPSGTVEITGPLFSAPGWYRADIEIITIDNDKTDLSTPLEYQFGIEVKK